MNASDPTGTPASWLEFFADRYPYEHEADLDHLLDGLRKAGLE